MKSVKLNPLTRLVMAAALAFGLAACGGGSSTTPTDPVEMPDPAVAQKAELATASAAVTTALSGLGGTPTQEAIDTATVAVGALKAALDAAMNVSDAEKAGYVAQHASATTAVSAAQVTRDEADDAVDAAEMKAMAATAAKLYAGTYAPAADNTGTEVGAVHAAYSVDDITVTIGDGSTTAVSATLSEDKDATVAANHGWEGKRYADPAGGAMVEAYVYSNVEAPEQGKKFGGATANEEFEYALTDGATSVGTDDASRVAITGISRTSGTETFHLPDPNPSNATNILVPGSYHGVSGTYSCVPTTPANGCSAAVAASGFTLGDGTWTFAPDDPSARVTEAADSAYSSYGWWLHKSADGQTFTASAFDDFKGTDTPAVNLPEVGTATYVGGAVGKYALSSATGGTNDAGHFTARAMLEAKFGTGDANTISGTIDSFVGGDGEMRDWSVALKEADVTDAGVISRTTDDDTVWTIGGTSAAASGAWAGALREEGDDEVPSVATGTFYSEYGTSGRMVGAFGANKE